MAPLDARLRRAPAPHPRRLPAMGAALFLGERWLADALDDRFRQYGALALLVALGLASYGAAAFATGALRTADIRAALRRPPGPPPRLPGQRQLIPSNRLIPASHRQKIPAADPAPLRAGPEEG